jgi:large subunit ribosomal protein L17
MHKRVFGRKLSQETSSRRALYRSLIRALVLTGGIKTTKAKARSIQPDVEKIMTLVRKGTVSSRRSVLAKLGNDREVSNRLYKDYSKITESRVSGFTKLIALPSRVSDRAEMAMLTWVELPKPDESHLEKKTKAKKTEKEVASKVVKKKEANKSKK